MREGKYKNYTEASKFIYAELRKCENRIADEFGLRHSAVDFDDWAYKIESMVIDQIEFEEDE